MSLWKNGLHHGLDMMMIYFDMTRVSKGSCVGIPTALMTCVHSFFWELLEGAILTPTHGVVIVSKGSSSSL
jgi:hypothetical protein